MSVEIIEFPPSPSYEQIVKELEERAKFRPVVGQIVRLHDDVGSAAMQKALWKVESLPKGNGVNYVLSRVGGGKGLRAQASHMKAASDTEVAAVAAAPEVERLVPGMTFRFGGKARGITADTVLVVLAENADGTVKAAPLGGDGGRYYPKLPLAACRKVEITV